MSSMRSALSGLALSALLIAACGGGDDDGGGGGGGGGSSPTAAERNAMVSALNASAVNAEAAGDDIGTLILKASAGLVGGGLTVTKVTGVDFARARGAAAILEPASLAGNGWAFGVELAMVQGTVPSLEVGVFRGAVVISGPDIAYGFGLASATPGFTGQSFGEIWAGPDAGWIATQLTGIGQADSIIGGDCSALVPVNLGVTTCTPASLNAPGFNITASAPISFPGNTAVGSNTMAFGPNRLRGAQVTIDCDFTTLC